MAEPEPSNQIEHSLVPLTKDQAKLLLEVGYLWLDMREFEKARAVFAGVSALMPKSEVPQLALGTLEFSAGKHDKALQAYRAAQKLAPKSALPRAYAAEALLFMGKVDPAMKEIDAALKAEPESDGARLATALKEACDAGALPPKKPEKRAKKG